MPFPTRAARPLAVALLLVRGRLQGRRARPRGSGRPRPSPWPRSRSATCRSRSAPRSTCARSSRPTSARRPSATSTRCWSTAATGCKKGQLLAVVRPSDLPDQLAERAPGWPSRRWPRPTGPGPRRWPRPAWSRSRSCRTPRAPIAAAQANLQAVATRLGETRIESPLDGVVSQRRLDPGALVGPSAGTGAILTVQRSDVLRVFVAGERAGRARACGSARRPASSSTRCPGKRFDGQGGAPLARPSTPSTRTARRRGAPRRTRRRAAPGHVRPRPHRHRRSTPARWWSRWAPCRSPTAATTPSWCRATRCSAREVEIGVDGGNWLEVVEGLAGRRRDRHRRHRRARRRSGASARCAGPTRSPGKPAAQPPARRGS